MFYREGMQEMTEGKVDEIAFLASYQIFDIRLCFI